MSLDAVALMTEHRGEGAPVRCGEGKISLPRLPEAMRVDSGNMGYLIIVDTLGTCNASIQGFPPDGQGSLFQNMPIHRLDLLCLDAFHLLPDFFEHCFPFVYRGPPLLPLGR